MSLRDERLLHRAPFVSACELREEQATSGGGGGGGAYGTVSQTAVIACRSERAIVYAYRETAAASGDDELLRGRGAASSCRRREVQYRT